MGLGNLFKNQYETSDKASCEELTTHYYAENYYETKEVILSIAKSLKFNVVNSNDDFKEIFIQMKKGDLIVTLFNPSFTVTAIDFTITTYYLVPGRKPLKTLKQLYEILNKRLTLKNIGGTN